MLSRDSLPGTWSELLESDGDGDGNGDDDSADAYAGAGVGGGSCRGKGGRPRVSLLDLADLE